MKYDLIKIISQKVNVYWIIIAVLTLIVIFPFTRYLWGIEEIDHFYEKPDYKTKYYAYLYKDSSDAEKDKVIVEIYRHKHPDMVDTPFIKLIKIINGESIIFSGEEDTSYSGCLLYIKEKVHCRDINGKDWKLELTNIKVGK